MRLKKGNRLANRSKSRSISPQRTAPAPSLDTALAPTPSQPLSYAGQKAKFSIRRFLRFKKKMKTAHSPSANRQNTPSPPPTLPTTAVSRTPVLSATVLSPSPANLPSPAPVLHNANFLASALPASHPTVIPATSLPSSPTVISSLAPVLEKTASPLSLPATPASCPPVKPTESSFKDIALITWDGFNEALRFAKESSDWNPFLKAALGGAVAVIELGKQVKGNSEEIESIIARIENLLPILQKRIDTYRPGPLTASGHVERCSETLEQELEKIKNMQTHGLLRRIMQGTSDGERLLGAYRRINDTLNDLQCAFGLAMEHDVDLIKQIVITHRLPFSQTAAYDAAVGNTISRQPCTKGTRLEVVGQILEWIRGADWPPVYWLTGPAGVGKTTIAQTLCRHVADATEVDGECERNRIKLQPLVSFFCSYQLDSGESKTLVPTLCQRLAEHFSSYAKQLIPALLQDSTLAHAALSTQFKRMLIDPWNYSLRQRKDLPVSVIIVDALDENKGGFEFLTLLLDAVKHHKLKGLRFLVTSRTDPEIAARCQSFPTNTICRLQEVSKADVQHDITLYLEASLPEVEEGLLRDLAMRAGNLFIYAATVVKMASGTEKSGQERIIGKVLEATSSGQSNLLDDLYARIVHEAIHHQDKDIQRSRLRVLHTVSLVYDRTTPKDLICQLSGTAHDVLSAVLKGLHAVMYTAKDGSILTYHASFSDFILRPPSSFNSLSYLNPLCDKGSHHAHLTRRCYEIMAQRLHFNICNLESSFDLDKDIPHLPNRIKANIDPVLRYALIYWMDHLMASRPEDDTEARRSLLLSNIPRAFADNLFLFWFEAFTLIDGNQDHFFLGHSGSRSPAEWIQKYCPEQNSIWREMMEFCQTLDRLKIPSVSTPHVYVSILSIWKPEGHISRIWRPRFPHIPNVRLESPTHSTGTESQGSQGDTGAFGGFTGMPRRALRQLMRMPPRLAGTMSRLLVPRLLVDMPRLIDGTPLLGGMPQLLGGTPQHLVGTPRHLVGMPRPLVDENGWVWLGDGCQIMWLPKDVGSASDYILYPHLDNISFDLQYLGPRWTRIYVNTPSQ